MLLYLVRHADALDAFDDHSRPLSPKGERQIAALGKFFARNGAFQPQEVWHSPLVRAGETALQLTRAIGLKVRMIEVNGLRPESDPGGLAHRLIHAPERLALVGHEPHLSAVASLLLANRAAEAVVAMEKGAVLALEGEGNYWVVRWLVTPELLE